MSQYRRTRATSTESSHQIRRKLEKISNEIDKVVHDVSLYGGVARGDRFVENLGDAIAEQGARVSGIARGGDEEGLALSRRVRKALGYTVP